MNVSKQERISALTDEEASEFEVRRLLAELAGDAETRDRWARYYLMGDAMRGELPAAVDPQFRARIMGRIERESPLRASRPSQLLKPAAGFGLAAAVAVAAIVGIRSMDETGPGREPAMVAGDGEASDASLRQARATSDEPRADNYSLNSYLLNHFEHAGGGGMLPHVRVVGYEAAAE